MHPQPARFLNILGLWGLSGILAVAFAYQFWLAELPCPLCLLQRAAFVAAGVGIALNVTTELRPRHYGMMIVSAITGGAVSGRQILLHIVPGSSSYGSALFGLHFYTWAFISFVVIILGAAVMLMLDRQFAPDQGQPRASLHWAATAAVFLFGAMALLNAGSTLAECGLGLCPDNPTNYEFFSPSRSVR